MKAEGATRSAPRRPASARTGTGYGRSYRTGNTRRENDRPRRARAHATQRAAPARPRHAEPIVLDVGNPPLRHRLSTAPLNPRAQLRLGQTEFPAPARDELAEGLQLFVPPR